MCPVFVYASRQGGYACFVQRRLEEVLAALMAEPTVPMSYIQYTISTVLYLGYPDIETT